METQMTRKQGPGAASRGRTRFARIAAIIAVSVAFCAYLDRETHAFDLLEQKTYGWRLEVAARVHAAAERRARHRIVLVTLSDTTFAAGSGLAPQPFLPRADHARLIRRLTRWGAKVIAFDMLFDTPQAGDDALADAIRSSQRVLLAVGDDSSDPPDLVLPESRLLASGAHRGHTRCPLDADRPALDRIRPMISEHGVWMPALCVETVRMALGGCDQPMRRVPNGWKCAACRIPVDEDQTFMLRYAPESVGPFTTVPYEAVLSAAAARAPFYRGIFQDKIVLIGDTTRIHGDVHLTPLGMMPGVEIQAHAVATLLAGRYLREAPWTWNLEAMIVLASLTVFSAMRRRMREAVLFLGLLLPIYFCFNIVLFVERDIVLRLVAPMTAVLLATVGIGAERGLTEEQEKTQMRALLQRYFSPQIAAYLLKRPELLHHAGTNATGTILFCDIRGFTALSERLPPEELVRRMNEYFEAMTEILFRHDGTVVNIIGDAMLAVFGVPVASDDHARRAVAAALEMQDALESLQEQWRAQGHGVFDIGIGINTGEMVAGDVGGRHLMNFTVYGLQVNIASRVEALNKRLGSRLLITQSTYDLVKDEITARGPLSEQLRGIEVTVDVYEVLSRR